MREVTNSNAISDDEGYVCDCEAFGLGAHEFVALYRRSVDNSINGLRRRRRQEQVIRKARRAFCILGAAGLSLSNASPSVMAQPFAHSNELQFTLADIKSEIVSKDAAPTYEMMIRRCRSRIDGSIRAINDAIRVEKFEKEFQHVITDLFYLDDHHASAVTMFQVKDHDGFVVMNEVRANLALPSCTVSKISFGLV